ncbi:MAG: pyridoxal-phosphate dependent enzyme [Thermoplasmata archaeon]|nr:pyridoxal-phosphate dependent enzyme [Thermoplasmata archaeon]
MELVREFERQMHNLRIGHTSFKRASRLEKKLGIRRLHLKLESENSSGTHKDRAALLYALDARKKGKDTLAAVTCGNYGAALAYVCSKLDMHCRVYVPSDFAATRNKDIEAFGGNIVITQGDYEAALNACVKDTLANGWYNANPGGPDKELAIYSYSFIAREIAQELGRQPDWISVPFGNGTILAGIWQGFRAMSMKPRIVGYSNNNSAIHGLVNKSRVPIPVEGLTITEVNEPLSGNFLLDDKEGMSAILESNGTAFEISDEELLKASKLIMDQEGLDILPASAGAITAITRLESRNHTFAAVITGRGHHS